VAEVAGLTVYGASSSVTNVADVPWPSGVAPSADVDLAVVEAGEVADILGCAHNRGGEHEDDAEEEADEEEGRDWVGH